MDTFVPSHRIDAWRASVQVVDGSRKGVMERETIYVNRNGTALETARGASPWGLTSDGNLTYMGSNARQYVGESGVIRLTKIHAGPSSEEGSKRSIKRARKANRG